MIVVLSASDALAEDVRRLLRDLHAGPGADEPAQPPVADVREPRHPALTKREREVLRLVARGRSNHQIAGELWVSQDTVRFHLRNAYRKLGVHSREAAVDAANLGPPAG